MQKILIVHDSATLVEDLSGLFRDQYLIISSPNGVTAFDILRTGGFVAALVDFHSRDLSCIEMLHRIHQEIDPYFPVIILTNSVNVERVVEVMRAGAYDCIPKDTSAQLLAEKINKALERRRLEIGMRALQSSFADHHDHLVLAGEAMKKIHYEITRLAQIDFDVLLVGETGVGKDLAAFEIHQRSKRREKPFISISMRSLSETLIESELFGHEKGAFSGADRTRVGKLEAANGGSVYIPEISSVSEDVQLKLLQFMQYKTIARVGQDARKPETQLEVRIIMATNENLEELVKKGKMRLDFYHRITGVKLVIPPLRERIESIVPLAEYFLKKFSGSVGEEAYAFHPDVLIAFGSYHWPGNVRELRNAIKSALVHASDATLTLKDFPNLLSRSEPLSVCAACLSSKFPTIPDFKSASENFKQAYFREVLKRSNDNPVLAAKAAGMTPQGFRKALRTIREEAKQRD